MSKWIIGAAAGLAALGQASAPGVAATAWPARVSANFTVNVAGFDLGRFNFQSDVNASTYRLTADARLKWGFGIFKWSSTNSSSGEVAGDGVYPAAYAFDYRSKKKKGAVRLQFNRAGVNSVSILPARSADDRRVPLKPHHLKGVFDPMSALIAMSRISRGNPCGKKIAIFDGKQRFDLLLTFRRQERVKETRPSGQPTLAYVCNVRYVPVAGHRPDKATRAMADTKGIEVALRPVPSAGIVVPVRITFPTIVGPVTILARTVDITAAGNKQIALSH